MLPRHRQIISRDGKQECTSVLEVCKEKVIISWMTGQIEIFSSVDLCSQTLLNYSDYCQSTDQSVIVTCVQCTCTEVIAGYNDGNICVWNIEKGILIHKFRLGHESGSGGDEDYATQMRRRGTTLVVGTVKGRVKIWQYVSSFEFTCVGSWDVTDGARIRKLDFSDNYVILQSHADGSRRVQVKYLNDLQPCRSISGPGFIYCWALDGNHLITGHDDKLVRIWDVCTGRCLTDEGLKGHDHDIRAVTAYGGVFASSDWGGRIIIWSTRAGLLGGTEAMLASFTHSTFSAGRYGWFSFQLGQQFLVRSSLNCDSRSVQVVTDFPW